VQQYHDQEKQNNKIKNHHTTMTIANMKKEKIFKKIDTTIKQQ